MMLTINYFIIFIYYIYIYFLYINYFIIFGNQSQAGVQFVFINSKFFNYSLQYS